MRIRYTSAVNTTVRPVTCVLSLLVIPQGLTHITDACFNFFVKLEEQRFQWKARPVSSDFPMETRNDMLASQELRRVLAGVLEESVHTECEYD